jgi:hypothetical protein
MHPSLNQALATAQLVETRRLAERRYLAAEARGESRSSALGRDWTRPPLWR